MYRRDRGFTLIEILVVITIIAALAGLVAALAPQILKQGEETTSMHNLTQIGGLLMGRDAARKIKYYSGAAFLLQVKDKIKDENLRVFISPADKGWDDVRPDLGSKEFIEMYRDLKLPGGVDDRHSSYAGPNWKDYKHVAAGREATKTRLWACDRCAGGEAFHDGLVVLYSGGNVEKIDLDNIEGVEKSGDNVVIQVGPHSPDERLKKMCYLQP